MKNKTSDITRVLALLTLVVFALCLLLVLLTGASIYRDLVDGSEISHIRRTARSYLSTRLHQAESVTLGTLEGCDALLLAETVDNETYITHIYCWDGWLRELYTVPGAEAAPEDGEPILEADCFSCAQDGRLLILKVNDDSIFLSLPVQREAIP